jgi:hypothetical protein
VRAADLIKKASEQRESYKQSGEARPLVDWICALDAIVRILRHDVIAGSLGEGVHRSPLPLERVLVLSHVRH